MYQVAHPGTTTPAGVGQCLCQTWEQKGPLSVGAYCRECCVWTSFPGPGPRFYFALGCLAVARALCLQQDPLGNKTDISGGCLLPEK